MSIPVRAGDLSRSCRQLREAAESIKESPPAHLLRYYAAECGLKHALLRRRNGRTTDDLPPQQRKGESGHDLRSLAKELRLADADYRELRACRRHGSGSVRHHELHEAWRYGVRLDAEEERRAVAALDRLVQWAVKEGGS
ncbi:hypothetical protein [Actinoalloteichus caeruleus]|uniref:hypothetical protein n=1 Tax=Actinoalloteichus cyanogriseus TaxID=2893586 RepID=UPI003AB012CB